MLKLDVLLDEVVLLFNFFDICPDLRCCRVVPCPRFRSPRKLVYHTGYIASTSRISVLIPDFPLARHVQAHSLSFDKLAAETHHVPPTSSFLS